MPSRTELGPLGKNPPLPARFSSPTGLLPGTIPKMKANPAIKKTTIVATFTKESQYSNSPNDLTE